MILLRELLIVIPLRIIVAIVTSQTILRIINEIV